MLGILWVFKIWIYDLTFVLRFQGCQMKSKEIGISCKRNKYLKGLTSEFISCIFLTSNLRVERFVRWRWYLCRNGVLFVWHVKIYVWFTLSTREEWINFMLSCENYPSQYLPLLQTSSSWSPCNTRFSESLSCISLGSLHESLWCEGHQEDLHR